MIEVIEKKFVSALNDLLQSMAYFSKVITGTIPALLDLKTIDPYSQAVLSIRFEVGGYLGTTPAGVI